MAGRSWFPYISIKGDQCQMYLLSNVVSNPGSNVSINSICPTWHILGADFEGRMGICYQNLPPISWYVVGIVPIHSNCIFHCVKCLWRVLCEFHRYPYLSVTHWYGIFVTDMQKEVCAPSMRVCFILIKPQVLEVGHTTDRCISNNTAHSYTPDDMHWFFSHSTAVRFRKRGKNYTPPKWKENNNDNE